MPEVRIMSVIGSAVPAPLRELGLLACWYLVQDGVAISGPLTSLSVAQALLQRKSADI
jgi:hypothetical protein